MGSFLKPTKENVIVSLVDSLTMILIGLIIPSLGFQSVFLGKELSGQIFYLVSNLFFSFVVYYPLACGLVYVFKIITGKEKVKGLSLVMALLFIAILNPITLSIVITKIVNKPQINPPTVIDSNTKEKLCGLQITEVTAPSAKNAGLVVGEVIKTVNDNPVDTMESLNHALTNKKPNDVVAVVTNANTYNVALFANPQNPQQALLGIKVNPTECGK
jgi:Na+-transporting methylmalonyl-CoA/oxaloacetate decarboxylase gamma subunit